MKSGELQIIWHQPVEHSLDELGHRLLEAVREHQIKRLFVDGTEGFRDAAVHPERLTLFMAALTNHLRQLNTTVLFSEEIGLLGEDISRSAFGVSAVVENMILLRYVELRSQFHRLIPIVKLRESHYDTAIHEFSISSHGMDVTASDALREISKQRPDIVLTDWMMPVMDGVKLCRHLRGDPQTTSIPIIMLTGASSLLPSKEHLWDLLLTKPVDFDELLARIKNLAPRHG